MTVLSLNPDDTERIDVPEVVTRLLDTFPTGTLYAVDSFERQRSEALGRLVELQQKGVHVQRDLIIGSINNKERSLGPGSDVKLVSASGAEIMINVWTRFIVCRANCDPDDAVVRELLEVLESLGIGAVDVAVV